MDIVTYILAKKKGGGGGGGSGSTVVVVPKLSTGTKIAEIEVDGSNNSLFAPSPGLTKVEGERLDIGDIGGLDVPIDDTAGYDATDKAWSADKLTRELANKQDKPATAGVAGQVLGLNEQLQPVWTDGGSGGADIDDTAGAGTTDKTWSANKLTTEFGGVHSVPTGGASGQILSKASGTNYDTQWVDSVALLQNDEGFFSLISNMPVASDNIDDTAGDGDVDKTWSADKLASELSGKQEAAANTGTSGQILSLNSQLKPVWINNTGSSASIDDNAGAGITNKAWSANKLTNKFGEVHSVPTGGTTGQVLAKNSSTNYDATWTDAVEVVSNESGKYTIVGNAPITGSLIDDNAGDEDTGVTWSADKLVDEFASKQDQLPSGGTTNQVLARDANGNLTWIDKVSVTSNLTTGVQIAAIRVDGTLTRIYAPAGGSIEVVRLA